MINRHKLRRINIYQTMNELSKVPCLVIRYAHHTGGQLVDRWMWEGILEGETEVYDWNTKNALITEAKRNGWRWKVLRLRRDGSWFVAQHGT